MMRDVRAALAAREVPSDQVHYEAFGTERRRPRMELFNVPNVPASTIAFAASGKTGRLPHAATVLEAAEFAGVQIDNACRSGTCGSCKVRLLDGVVTMDCQYALAPGEKGRGVVLACQAKATKDVRIDA
jgi:ferredoxin